jgi:hypothetical protein
MIKLACPGPQAGKILRRGTFYYVESRKTSTPAENSGRIAPTTGAAQPGNPDRSFCLSDFVDGVIVNR